ncbi:MAG: nitrogen fixation protein NifX [Magnetococcales bacterium]|nr:nitrogen fixation protein NifX [Magnetococcales bacterium]
MACQRAPQPIVTGEFSQAIRVAFATSDMTWVDEHFGVARQFAIYRINTERAELERVVEFAAAVRDGGEDKLIRRLQALDGCAAVHCLAIGASAVRQLLKRKVQPILLDDREEVSRCLIRARQQLAQGRTAGPFPPRNERATQNWLKQSLQEETWGE